MNTRSADVAEFRQPAGPTARRVVFMVIPRAGRRHARTQGRCPTQGWESLEGTATRGPSRDDEHAGSSRNGLALFGSVGWAVVPVVDTPKPDASTDPTD
jgi:hypothetical protein